MIGRLVIVLSFIVLSSNLTAAERVYQADVEGMVCAFCAYSVSRELAALPGVEPDSVNVDLNNGKVIFQSTEPVSEATLVSVFEDTGFRITSLSELDSGSLAHSDVNYQLVLSLTIRESYPSLFEAILESVGALAAQNPSKIILTAPAMYEDDLLKPILVGRRQVMKVRFVPASDGETIQLQLFLAIAEN